MRWKIDTSVPMEGERRQITKFAWLPTRVRLGGLKRLNGVKEDYTIWLEKYTQVQRYTPTKQKIGSTYGWIDKEKYIYESI